MNAQEIKDKIKAFERVIADNQNNPKMIKKAEDKIAQFKVELANIEGYLPLVISNNSFKCFYLIFYFLCVHYKMLLSCGANGFFTSKYGDNFDSNSSSSIGSKLYSISSIKPSLPLNKDSNLL